MTALPDDSGIPPRHTLAGVALAALSGLALAAQAKVNGRFADALRAVDPKGGALAGILAAVISTAVGLALLALVVPLLPAGRRGPRRLRHALRGGGLRWWECLGGACGAVLVSTQGLVASALGVAVFTVALVAGQVLASLAVDRAGLGPAGRRPLTVRRTVGALFAVPAVAVAVADQFGHQTVLLLAALPLIAGAGLAWQQAMNGRVTVAAGDGLVGSLVNFTVAEVVLLVGASVPVALLGVPARLPGPWFLYLGGPLGVVLIATAIAAVRLVGVLVLGLSSVAGQLVGALLLETLLPGGPGGSVLYSAVGTVLALVAVAVAGLPGRTGSAKMAAGDR
ncbi:MAG TPA: DMT family transporter [Pseudonocardiaceae bacterium]|nr:DMT family transporter [Pseudonocardiaceae bacterium]